MACAITIIAVAADPAVPGGILITGTVSGCSKIDLTVTCGSNTYPGQTTLLTPTLWEGAVTGATACSCGQDIAVTATCSGDPSCSTTFTGSLCCCPQSSTQVIYGSCTGNSELVSFFTTVSIDGPCSFTVQRAFGNGLFGSQFPLTGPGTFSLPMEQSSYSTPGSYSSGLNVISPSGSCGTIETVPVAAQCGACHTSSLIAFICKILEFTFLLFGSAGLAALIAPACVPLPIALSLVGTAIAALAIFMIPILGCQKCICSPVPKFLGQVFLSGGIILVMFILPPCPSWAPALALAPVYIGLGSILLNMWYHNNRSTCPLIICDLWCAVGGLRNPTACTNIAILGASLLWALTAYTFTFGWFISLVVVLLVAMFANSPLTTSPCNNRTQTCQ